MNGNGKASEGKKYDHPVDAIINQFTIKDARHYN